MKPLFVLIHVIIRRRERRQKAFGVYAKNVTSFPGKANSVFWSA